MVNLIFKNQKNLKILKNFKKTKKKKNYNGFLKFEFKTPIFLEENNWKLSIILFFEHKTLEEKLPIFSYNLPQSQ